MIKKSFAVPHNPDGWGVVRRVARPRARKSGPARTSGRLNMHHYMPGCLHRNAILLFTVYYSQLIFTPVSAPGAAYAPLWRTSRTRRIAVQVAGGPWAASSSEERSPLLTTRRARRTRAERGKGGERGGGLIPLLPQSTSPISQPFPRNQFPAISFESPEREWSRFSPLWLVVA